jgi:epoxyqueuosine reductase
MGNRIYGCDDCLAVCPWNKFASVSHEARLVARDDLNAPALSDLAALDDAEFREFFSRSPIKRIGHARFLRNVLIAIGNSADPGLLPLARARLADPDPLIRGAAVWAVRRLVPAQEASRLALDFLSYEGDTSVRTEWTTELPA